MSLAAFAIRTCTVCALRGRTLAGAAVYDSPVDMAGMVEEAATPSIFVFSDMERLEGLSTRDLIAGDNTIDLALMIVLPTVFEATIGGATVEFEDGAAGAAVAIDLIYRQVQRALMDEASVWSRLWNVFVASVHEVEAHAYVLPVGKGNVQRKLPARAIRLVIQPLREPPFGAEPRDVWAELVAALQTDPGYAPLAPLLAGAIQGDALPGWRVDALEVGDTAADAIAMGYGPLGGGAMDPLVPAVEVDVRQAVPGAAETTFTVRPAEDGPDIP